MPAEEVEFIIVDQSMVKMSPSPGNQHPGYRNLISIYVKNFSESDEVFSAIEKNAKTHEHSINGYTVAFYFDSLKNTPPVSAFNDISLDERYFHNCVAGYWHYPSGLSKFKRYPL